MKLVLLVISTAVFASYSDVATKECNCDTELREDYFKCEPAEEDVSTQDNKFKPFFSLEEIKGLSTSGFH